MIVDTEKIMKKESKQNSKKIIKPQRKQVREKRKEQRGTTKTNRTINKMASKKYIPINNYFKYKGTKFSNQKT